LLHIASKAQGLVARANRKEAGCASCATAAGETVDGATEDGSCEPPPPSWRAKRGKSTHALAANSADMPVEPSGNDFRSPGGSPEADLGDAAKLQLRISEAHQLH
jgi:hypothetical protein